MLTRYLVVTRRSFKWKKGWASLKGSQIYFYKSKESQKPFRKVLISYWEKESLPQDKVAEWAKERKENVLELEQYLSSNPGEVFRCFTTTAGVIHLSFPEGEEEKWNSTATALMDKNWPSGEVRRRDNVT